MIATFRIRRKVIGIALAANLLGGTFAILSQPSSADAAGDNLWYRRRNFNDFFHSNDSWVRPWDGDNDTQQGRFVGAHGYHFDWHNLELFAPNADGSFYYDDPQDTQFHFWTYVYVEDPTTVVLSGGGDSVPRWFLDYEFDTPHDPAPTWQLSEGWHRIDITGYNQNSRVEFSSGPIANQVDAMHHDPVDAPIPNFSWNPAKGWAENTLFSFSDTSENDPDQWAWDVDNDDIVDYASQNVSGHTYSAPAGGSVLYSAKLEVGITAFGDLLNREITQPDIIEVFGRPIADFDYTATGLVAEFGNLSQEPGKLELGGYSYAWDMDDDGQFDDAFVENPQWAFPGVGDYVVGFRVTNGAGSSSMSQTVTLVPEPGTLSLLALGLFVISTYGGIGGLRYFCSRRHGAY